MGSSYVAARQPRDVTLRSRSSTYGRLPLAVDGCITRRLRSATWGDQCNVSAEVMSTRSDWSTPPVGELHPTVHHLLNCRLNCCLRRSCVLASQGASRRGALVARARTGRTEISRVHPDVTSTTQGPAQPQPSSIHQARPPDRRAATGHASVDGSERLVRVGVCEVRTAGCAASAPWGWSARRIQAGFAEQDSTRSGENRERSEPSRAP